MRTSGGRPAGTVMLTLGRFRGVPIMIAPAWLLVAVVLTVVYGPIVDDAVPDVSSSTAYLTAFGFAVVFAACILAHEIGHTVVSLALGHQVQRIVLFVLGGVSEIDGEPTRARDELLIAGAGPLVSVLIAGASWGVYLAVPDASLAGALFALLAWSNVVLAGFNLLPGLPLDGGRLLRAAVWGCGASALTGTRVASWAGRAIAVVIAVAALVANQSWIGFAAALFTILLASYLWAGATQALRLAELRARLPEIDVATLLRPGLLVPGDLSVAEAVRRLHETGARGLVVMDAEERPSAIVDERLVGEVPAAQRAWTPLTEVARPLEPGLVLPADIDAGALLERIRRLPAREYLVVDGAGAPTGILTAADFANRLRT